ncbi:hypothetical protein PC116_g17199 [Phytophthora cactorum]|nr:hypothetical protein PC116_g17199 [Phytophthora cactorum]
MDDIRNSSLMVLVQVYKIFLKYVRIFAQLKTLKEAVTAANRGTTAVQRTAERKENLGSNRWHLTGR